MFLTDALELTIVVLIALIGVVGNILVVIVIHHLGKKKRPGDCYLQSLAIADIGTLLITSPLVIIRMEMPLNWPFGEFACLYVYPVAEIFYGASIWSIVVIAANHYHQMFSLKIFGRTRPSIKRAKTIAALVWVLSFIILSFPLYFAVDYRELLNGGQFCGPVKWTHFSETAYIICLTLLTYVIPLAVISFTYVAISRVLRQNIDLIKAMKQVLPPVATSPSNQRDHLTHVKSIRLKQNIRARKILSPLVVTFAVTMLPLNVFRLTMVFWPAGFSGQEYFKHLLYGLVISTTINSAANPIIYSVVSRDFRKGILNNLRCISWV